jgi:hypothetical protein
MANNLRIALHDFPSRPLMPIEHASSSSNCNLSRKFQL